MAAGLAQPQQSSAGYAVMGAQAEIALNSGWSLDQKMDGAGGFLTNTSPTSSGLTFLSTGDATGFYQRGRAIKAIQAAGTVIATVGQSSFAAGLTSVYLNQFSTQSGLSTVMTTGVITSVSAGPLLAASTENNVFGGATPSASTSGIGVGIGSGFASSGYLRLPASAISIVDKTSSGGDSIVWPHQTLSGVLSTDFAMSTLSLTISTPFLFNVPVAGMWFVTAGVTFQSTAALGQPFYFIARINSGGFTWASAQVPHTGGASTSDGASAHVAAFIPSTGLAAVAVNVLTVGASSTLKVLGGTQDGFAGSTYASYYYAVKIG